MNFIRFDYNDESDDVNGGGGGGAGGSAFSSSEIIMRDEQDISPLNLPSTGNVNDNNDNRSTVNSTINGNLDLDEFELWNEFVTFKKTWETLIEIYVPLEIVVMILGLIGNLLALSTLTRSRNMCTPSFAYHRALVFADFVFCLNYFVNVFVDKLATIQQRSQFEFNSWWAAYYSGVIYHAVHLTCTYVILYMTIVITADRFVALLLYKGYRKFNRSGVAYVVVTLCLMASIFFHSWAAWIQREVVITTGNKGDFQASARGNNNHSLSSSFTWIKRQNLTDSAKTALHVKDIYNGVVRLAYPIIISILTIGVIYGFIRRQRYITERYAGAHTARRQRIHYEKTLFFFMIAVVVLTFLEVASGECRRFIEILYPPGEISLKIVTNWRLPVSERLYYFRILLYGYQISRLVSNLCTAFNRSFLCYFYMIMNNLFRKELIALLCCCQQIEEAGLLRQRTLSHSIVHYNSVVNSTLVHKESCNGHNWISEHKTCSSSKKISFV